jgi:hypothetical protein
MIILLFPKFYLLYFVYTSNRSFLLSVQSLGYTFLEMDFPAKCSVYVQNVKNVEMFCCSLHSMLMRTFSFFKIPLQLYVKIQVLFCQISVSQILAITDHFIGGWCTRRSPIFHKVSHAKKCIQVSRRNIILVVQLP